VPRAKKQICILDGCDDEADYKKSKMCKRCYARVYAQMKRGVSWAVGRADQIRSWQSGLEMIMGNATSLKEGRRRRSRRRAA
jgi:hypothetical protein